MKEPLRLRRAGYNGRLAHDPGLGLPEILGTGSPAQVLDLLEAWLRDTSLYEDDWGGIALTLKDARTSLKTGNVGDAMSALWNLAGIVHEASLEENEKACYTSAGAWGRKILEGARRQRRTGGAASHGIDPGSLDARDAALAKRWQAVRPTVDTDSAAAAVLAAEFSLTSKQVLVIADRQKVRNRRRRNRKR